MYFTFRVRRLMISIDSNVYLHIIYIYKEQNHLAQNENVNIALMLYDL